VLRVAERAGLVGVGHQAGEGVELGHTRIQVHERGMDLAAYLEAGALEYASSRGRTRPTAASAWSSVRIRFSATPVRSASFVDPATAVGQQAEQVDLERREQGLRRDEPLRHSGERPSVGRRPHAS
jgi:hypothetical protein